MRIALSLLYGLFFGSFANVFFHRWPSGQSLLRPGSSCPSCGKALLWRDNVPLISFLLLRGKCRFCRRPISWRYPLVELICGILFAGTAVLFRRAPAAQLAGALAFSFLLFLIAGTDFHTYFQSGGQYGIIPDPLVGLLGVLGLALWHWNPYVQNRFAPALAGGAGGLILMGFFRWLGERMFGREALGLGDVKMVAAVGLWLGWRGVTFTLIAGSALGSLVGLVLMGAKKLDRTSAVPFGPFLALGAWAALFF